jgi:hypothetical protein
MKKFSQIAILTGTMTAAFVWALFPAVAQQGEYGQQPAATGPGGKGGGKGRGKGRGAVDTAPKGPAPRRPDGKVDFTGNWTPNAINQNVDLARATGEQPDPVASFYKMSGILPWAQKLYEERKNNLSKDDPEGLCLPPGVPRMSTTPYPWSMIQNDKELVIIYEGGAHIWRKIFLDGRKHDPNTVETWLGDSTGRWLDNDTLEVETVGQTDKTWLDESGLPHTKDMVVTERFKRLDEGHMEIVHTIHDPGAYSKDWTFTTHPTQLKGELIEYICQENNRDVQHLVGK